MELLLSGSRLEFYTYASCKSCQKSPETLPIVHRPQYGWHTGALLHYLTTTFASNFSFYVCHLSNLNPLRVSSSELCRTDTLSQFSKNRFEILPHHLLSSSPFLPLLACSLRCRSSTTPQPCLHRTRLVPNHSTPST